MALLINNKRELSHMPTTDMQHMEPLTQPWPP